MNIPFKNALRRIKNREWVAPGPRISSALSDETDWTTVTWFRDCRIWCGPNNKIEREILWNDGKYDRLNFSVIEQLVHKDCVCFDIGANIGVYSAVFSRMCGDSRLVHSFEPVNHIRAKLIDNARLNNSLSLNVNDFALGDTPTVMDMYQVKKGVFRAGTSTLVKNESIDKMGEEKFEVCPVRVRTLDDYVEEHSLERLDFIKIDVEGFEWNVLKGGRNAINRLRPSILMEFDMIRHANDKDVMRAYFEELGYQVFQIRMVKGCVCYIPWMFQNNPDFRNVLCRPLPK